MGAILILLLLCLPAGAQVWGSFTDLPYMNQARVVSTTVAASCNETNVFVSIPYTGSVNADSLPDGSFLAQKIKNLSAVPIRIKRLTMPIQYNSGTGSAVMTGYVRDNADFASGSTYGSASVSTNTLFTPSGEGGRADLMWAAGTEPVIAAATDFFIGMRIQLNGASMNYAWAPVGGGTYYQDTAYAAYINGAYTVNGDIADYRMDIYACDESQLDSFSTYADASLLNGQIGGQGPYWGTSYPYVAHDLLPELNYVDSVNSLTNGTHVSTGIYYSGTNYWSTTNQLVYVDWTNTYAAHDLLPELVYEDAYSTLSDSNSFISGSYASGTNYPNLTNTLTAVNWTNIYVGKGY